MGDILATGPMKVPGRMPGGGPPDAVHVSIKNPTNKSFQIQLFAEVCDPNGPEATFPDAVFTVPSHTCLTRTFHFIGIVQPGDILRFFAVGDVDEDGGKLELSFVGQRLSDQMNEPTMFFRHADLIEVDDDNFDEDAAGAGAAGDAATSSIGHWGN